MKAITILCADARGTISEHTRCGGFVVSGTEIQQECECSCHVPDQENGLLALSPRRREWALQYATHHERAA